MPKGQAKPKAVDTAYFNLVKPPDLFEALTEMFKEGYNGNLTAHHNPDGELWGVQLSSETQPEFRADLGEVILWDGTELRKISGEEFKEKWNP